MVSVNDSYFSATPKGTIVEPAYQYSVCLMLISEINSFRYEQMDHKLADRALG